MYTTMTHKKTMKEFKYISKESLELFTKLLEAETIGKKEHLIVPLLLDELKKRNFTVNTDEINNIYAIRGYFPCIRDTRGVPSRSRHGEVQEGS